VCTLRTRDGLGVTRRCRCGVESLPAAASARSCLPDRFGVHSGGLAARIGSGSDAGSLEAPIVRVRMGEQAAEAATSARDVLLATKLNVPGVRPDLVPRARLVERLDEGRARGLVLACAPAGYGKTVLL